MIRRTASRKSNLQKGVALFQFHQHRSHIIAIRKGAHGFYPGDVIRINNSLGLYLAPSKSDLYLVLGTGIDEYDMDLALMPFDEISERLHRYSTVKMSDYATWLYNEDYIFAAEFPDKEDESSVNIRYRTPISIEYRFGAKYIDEMEQVPIMYLINDYLRNSN